MNKLIASLAPMFTGMTIGGSLGAFMHAHSGHMPQALAFSAFSFVSAVLALTGWSLR